MAAPLAIGITALLKDRLLREVAEDPYTQFLCGVWCMEFADQMGEGDEQADDAAGDA